MRLSVLALVAIVVILTVTSDPFPRTPVDLCGRTYCECSPTSHPVWLRARCSLQNDQAIAINEDDVSERIIEMEVIGGMQVDIYSYAFKHNHDIRKVLFNGTGTIYIRTHAFYDSTTVNTLLHATNCKSVNIQTLAFKYMSGSVSLKITNSKHASIGQQAFTWIHSIHVADVDDVSLGNGVFIQEGVRPSVGSHGPEFVIFICNTTMKEIPSQAFGSSAAEIKLDGLRVGIIRENAFNANTYNLVVITRSTIDAIEGGSFAQKTLINNLEWNDCVIRLFSPNAILSAMSNLTIQNSRLDTICPGAINTTVATVNLISNVFETFLERGFEFQAWNKLQVNGNCFNEMEPRAIIAPFTYTSGLPAYSFSFVDNEMIKVKPESLKFVGELLDKWHLTITYKYNYFKQICSCGIMSWLTSVMGLQTGSTVLESSYCTLDDIFILCFKIPTANMLVKRFNQEVCGSSANIICPTETNNLDEVINHSKDARHPHRHDIPLENGGLNNRNWYVIKVMVFVAVIFVLIIILISLISFIKRNLYCRSLKIAVIICNTFCAFCRFVTSPCGARTAPVNAGSNSRISVYEYSERHRLNEPLAPLPIFQCEIPTNDKATQTLPENLSRELIDTLKLQLDDPYDYNEAREVIEHLYELIKAEENCNHTQAGPDSYTEYENIYDLPLQQKVVYVGRNQKEMVCAGTQTPSFDQMLQFAPYNGMNPLCNEYFEPMDMTPHMYDEIPNHDAENRGNCSQVPNIAVEQLKLRGPYLRAMRDKKCDSPKPIMESFEMIDKPQSNTARSNKSTASNSSSRMHNRPLPEKPFELVEGTSSQKG